MSIILPHKFRKYLHILFCIFLSCVFPIYIFPIYIFLIYIFHIYIFPIYIFLIYIFPICIFPIYIFLIYNFLSFIRLIYLISSTIYSSNYIEFNKSVPIYYKIGRNNEYLESSWNSFIEKGFFKGYTISRK